MNGHTLTCENLTIGYESALGEPVTFTVPPGSVLAVVGPSGCGKSTLLSTIAGVIPARSGRVLIDGVDVTQIPTHARKVAMVFQEPLLFPTMTVRDNVAYGPRRSGASASEARSTADELLSWVDLAGLGDRNIDQLSGGQAQRVSPGRRARSRRPLEEGARSERRRRQREGAALAAGRGSEQNSVGGKAEPRRPVGRFCGPWPLSSG